MICNTIHKISKIYKSLILQLQVQLANQLCSNLCIFNLQIQEMIGIIIPPGEIKKMVEKTASHVAKNGSQFEKALIEIEQNKPQFSFLLKENPYRAYYDHMVAQYSKKLMAGNQENKQQPQQVQEVKQQVQRIQKQIEQNQQQAEFLQKIFEQIKEPDPDRFSVEIPEKLTRGDMTMIQHTAQYVAINGKNFLIALSQRQKNNPQFQFLRSSSDNHQYFTKIVAAYTAIMLFGQEDIKRLQQYAKNKDHILQKCRQVYEYHRMKMEQNKGKKDQSDNKKESNIDWNDFELVQTIVFEDYKSKAGYSDQLKINKPLFSNKNLEQKIISQPKKKQLLQMCHVCKKNILASQMTKHLKSCLSMGQNKPGNTNGQSTNGASVDVSKNLSHLSLRRPDIFGGESQAIRKQEFESQQDKIIWDGQAPNMTRSTASIAMLQNQQKKAKQQLAKDTK